MQSEGYSWIILRKSSNNKLTKNCKDRCTKWLGWPSHIYPSSTTTVTTTTLLSPIPGPMPYAYTFAKVDITHGRFHTEATPWQRRSPLPPNSPSLPASSDWIRNLPSRRSTITARSHSGTEDTCRILPGWPPSGTATTTPWSRSSRLTATFPQIIMQRSPPMKTVTAIMTTTREEIAEDNQWEGGGLPGWGIWGGQRSLSDAETWTCALGSLTIG